MRPMLASVAESVPAGDGWVHEVKWDGMRVMADVRDGAVRLTSRTERDVTVAFPELAGLAAEYDDMHLDGEVVSLRDGVPSFEALGERMHVGTPEQARRLAAQAPVRFVVFDVVRLLGVDLTGHPLAERRALLERLELEDARWHTPPTFPDGAALLAATREQRLEGIVSKRLAGRYVPGARSHDWRKTAHRHGISVVVGGWRPESTGSGRLGGLLVGLPTAEGLRFCGRVGSGLAGAAGERLLARLAPLASRRSPFAGTLEHEHVVGATWVRPEVVIDVTALGVSDGGRLRAPAYKGVREDLTADGLDSELGELGGE